MILHGDALEMLATLEPDSVQCVVTSPPYWGLRSYLADEHPDKAQELGLESTPEEYLERMVAVFEQVRRVLRPDGVAFVNMGDGYAQQTIRHRRDSMEWEGRRTGAFGQSADGLVDDSYSTAVSGLKPKDLIGMPWRLAFALQAAGADTSSIRAIDRARTAIIDAYDGQPLPDRALDALDRLAVEYEGAKGQSWWLRSDIIWAKGVSFNEEYSGSVMPESVTDRPTKAHEYVFLLTKQARYYYDADAVREGAKNWGTRERKPGSAFVDGTPGRSRQNGGKNCNFAETGRNLRTVWTINPEPTPLAHFATFPQKLAATCILAGTSERGACAACGKPWERVVEKEPMVVRRTHNHPDYLRTRTSGTMVSPPRSQTTGFRPACSCGTDETRPCVVLDPFMGSGTTGLVAYRYGREFIGIELNESYIEMAERRMAAAKAQPQLLTL